MPNLPQHPYDSVAEELARWINDEPSYYAQALTAGYRAPFSAKVSESDKLNYYKRMFYQTGQDGEVDYQKPNTEGRNQLLKRIGYDQYIQVAKAIAPGRGAQHLDEVSQEVPVDDSPNV